MEEPGLNVLTQLQPGLVWLSVGVAGAVLVELLARRVLVGLVQRTEHDLDDAVLALLRHPAALSVLAIGLGRAASHAPVSEATVATLLSLLKSGVILLWARAGYRLGRLLLSHFSKPKNGERRIHPRSVSALDFLLKLGIVGLAAWLGLQAWHIDATTVVASFGIVGLAVGLAAQESLASLFAGILIVVDAPFKIGDVLTLEDGTRGEVIEIGLRSCRLLTLDQVEISVPNSIMANTRIVNETGGPSAARRVRVPIGVAYGTELAHAKAVLKEAVGSLDAVITDDPERLPAVVVSQFGASSVDLEVLVWVEDPRDTTWLLDDVNTAMYNALNAADIEIPYPKSDVYLYASGTPAGSSEG